MDESQPNYHREFLKSPHHVWLGLLTLGSGFLLASPLPLIVGATAYALGWIYLPDMGLFRKWVDHKGADARRQAALAQVEEFLKQRETLLSALSAGRRARYTD